MALPCAVSTSEVVHSPDLFSDEEDICYDDNIPETSSSYDISKASIPHPSHQEAVLVNLELARLRCLLERLQGVPPPPSKTIPQIGVTDVLRLWNNHLEERVSIEKISEAGNTIKSLWKPSVSQNEAVNAKWPSAKYLLYFDLHYNVCGASEDIERLSMKLHERYVGAETSSWCSPATSALTSSAKKRQRTRTGHSSPGCRLSHLARRRQTFSSANLAQLSSVAGSGAAGGVPLFTGKGPSAARRLLMSGPCGSRDRRRIMVEIKKTDRNKRVKIIKNDKTKDRTSVSATESSSLSSTSVQEKPSQSTKRALFQSPEEEKQASLSSVVPIISEQNPAQRSKRALWPSDSLEPQLTQTGKRLSDMGIIDNSVSHKVHCPEDRSHYTRTSRSLPFSTSRNISSNNSSEMDKSRSTHRASDQGTSFYTNSLSGLSELHKRKLLWAISLALRKEGISSKNTDFQPCANMLAHHYIRVRRMTNEVPASTSEHMLKVVSAKVGEVVETYRVSQVGQEENHCAENTHKREERLNRGLFRDSTALLNVRRSLSIPVLSSDNLSADTKLERCRVPSARKSLSFESVHTKDYGSQNVIANLEYHVPLEENGVLKNVSERSAIPCVKRVSRSLFLSPSDEIKRAENKNALEKQSDELKSCLPSLKSENSSSMSERKLEEDSCSEPTCSKSASSDCLKNDLSLFNSNLECITTSDEVCDEKLRDCGVSTSKEANQVLHCSMGPSDNTSSNDVNLAKLKIKSNFSEAKCAKQLTGKSLSLSKGKPRNGALNGSDKHQAFMRNVECNSQCNNTVYVSQAKGEFRNLSKVSSTIEESDYMDCSKDIIHSGSVELNTVTEALPNFSMVNSCNTSTTQIHNLGNPKIVNDSLGNFKSKAIASSLVGTSTEYTACYDGESWNSMDTPLTFQGCIDNLKPIVSTYCYDLKSNCDTDVHLPNAPKNADKGPVLAKWAERASMGLKNLPTSCENSSENKSDSSALCSKQPHERIEESLFMWEDSQHDSSQYSTKLFEQYKSIFDSSSQHGSS